MVPTRSTRSSSRRSSILKTPKRRQPLQNIDLDKLPNESTPAKIKRRVSFAEKKHVKEFCNSLEQGTVWDNTYEEHDLSKVPCSSNEQQFEDTNVCKDSISIHSKDVQFSINDSIKEVLHVKQMNVHIEDVVEDIRYQNGVTETALSAPFHNDQENKSICSIDVQLKSNSLVSRSISVYEDENTGKVVELSQSRRNTEHVVQNNTIADVVKDVSMEFTTIVSTDRKRNIDENKTKRLDISMEVTTPVVPCNLQTNRCFTNLLAEDQENRTIYLNNSVEMTEVLPTFHRSTVIQKAPLRNYLTEDEVTKALNTSMEMTEAVPINVNSIINIQDRNEIDFNNDFKKMKYDPQVCDTVQFNETRYCDDDVMEFTTLVTSAKPTEETDLEVAKRDTPQLSSFALIRDRTEIFPNNSMTMTNVISSLGTNNDCEEVYLRPGSTKASSEKTVVFPNTSMEITEAVTRRRNSTSTEDLMRCANFVCEASMRSFPAEHLQKSMEITEAVRGIRAPDEVDLLKSMEITEAVKTVQPYVDPEILVKSMEITEAVPRSQSLIRREDPQKSMELTEAVGTVQPYVESEILAKSMEITEAVPRSQSLMQREDPQKSMEFTEAVGRVQPYVDPEILAKSMEITEAVPRSKILIQREDTRKSMELTEAVRTVQPYIEPEGLVKSMEITESVRTVQPYIEPEVLVKSMEITEAVKTVQPYIESDLTKSMEITEAIARAQTRLLEDDLHKSMEFTEAVRSIQPYVEPHLVKSMGVTEAVRAVQPHVESDLKKSMEITEAVARAQTRLREDDFFKSMEFTEAPISMETPFQEKDVEKAMEITESVMQEQRPLEKFANSGLRSLPNLEKNSATNFDALANKENYSVCTSSKNLENNVAEISGSIEIQKFASNKSNTALHEPMQLDNCASALQTSNMDVACAALNSASSVNSEIKIPAITVTKPSRRTYVIKPLIHDRTFTVNSNQNNINEEVDSGINNKETSSSQNDIKNSQNANDCDVENSEVFMVSDLEDIESIKPPPFFCLNDLSDTPTNINDQQEIMEEVIPLSKDNDDEYEHASRFEHHEANVSEHTSKNATRNILDNSKIEQGDRLAETDVIKKPRVLNNEDIDMDIQVLECSSSTVNSNENSPPVSSEKILQPSYTSNSKLENRNEVCPSPKIRSEHENELKAISNEPDNADDECILLSAEENLIRKLKICAKSDDIIWDVFYVDLDKKRLFVIGFISCSLLVVVYLQERCNFRSIKEIKLISRLKENADMLIHMVHRLIIQKIDTEELLSRFRVYDDVLPLLDCISKEVELAMDFKFDLDRLNNLYLMEFTGDSISFLSRTDKRHIILKVTVVIKPFEKIGPEDVSIRPLYGSLRDDNSLKKLIMHVKRDHKFLRRFMQDVNSYISIEEDFLNDKKDYI